ncbi:hypothetical protein V865_006390 [Kwoniella europaea PYCC6329]|uniref:Major facilitator superfamily (MFS) profile domain-containing protein n=1 Tax=Kwoniella europaea PYCC6329 TaxID=1423913 RepID=A0AAX4KQL9_9TREE
MSTEDKINAIDSEKNTTLTNVAEVSIDDIIPEVDYEGEKSAIRKIDRNLIIVFAALYMMSFLDRSNIGNANLTGFSTDLGLKGNEYGAAVSLVYATYVIFEPIWAVSLKMIGPRNVLTGTTICWSALTVGTAFAKNFGHLAAIRVLLGALEAGVIPCINVYLTMTYQRHEYMTRITVVFVASALSGAFGGLLAYGLSQLTAGGLHGWQWMYIVEGLISFCLAPVAWWQIPNSIAEARWLNEREKAAMKVRLERNRHIYDPDEKFSHKAILASFKDPRVYVHAVTHFGIDCTLYSLTTFMPTLVAGLGFTSTVTAQLLTVPVYVIAGISFAICGTMSDRKKIRSPFLVFALSTCLIGYIILAVAPQVGVRYAGVFIAAIGLYTSTAIHNMWVADNMAGHYKRAFSIGFVCLVGNSSGACIGFIFTAQTKPRYLQGLHFDIGMTLMAMVGVILQSFYCRYLNKKKREAIAAGAPNDPSLGDKNPHYMFFL